MRLSVITDAARCVTLALSAVVRRTSELANRIAEETWFASRQDQQVSPALDPVQPPIQRLFAQCKWAGREADCSHPSAEKRVSVRLCQGTIVVIIIIIIIIIMMMEV